MHLSTTTHYNQPRSIQMNSKSTQHKQLFKDQIHNFMEEYEKQQKEQQQAKLRIKKNVMLEILSNRQNSSNERQQSHGRSHTFQTMLSDKPSEQDEDLNDIEKDILRKDNVKEVKTNFIKEPYSNPQSRVEEFQQKIPIESITFHPKRKNKSLQQEINLDKSSFVQMIRKNLANNSTENNQNTQQINEEHRQEINEDNQHQKLHFYNQMDQNMRSNDSSELKNQSQEVQNADIDEIDDSQIKEDQRGVFLTVDEQESMDISEVPKSVAFEITVNKASTTIEELRKIKIMDLQKKREERIDQFRRNQSQKKVEIPRGRNNKKKHENQEHEIEAPRSVTNERKGKQKNENNKQNPSTKIETHESQYQLRPNNNKKSQLMYSNYQDQEKDIKPLSPFRTPKSILSENKGKSTNRNNIFQGESPQPREKSTNKLMKPEIDVKDRKNSFTKQSNKKLMINAITYVCFPGELNKKERQKLIEVLEGSEHEFFMFLFKEYSRKIIKGIYILDHSQTRLEKIYGEKAPQQIVSEKVQEFYRFDSGSREFKKVDGCKSFSLAIHAIDLR